MFVTGELTVITSLSDDQFNLIGFQAVNGSFSVVPEPPSLIPAAVGAGAGAGILLIRTTKRRSALEP